MFKVLQWKHFLQIAIPVFVLDWAVLFFPE